MLSPILTFGYTYVYSDLMELCGLESAQEAYDDREVCGSDSCVVGILGVVGGCEWLVGVGCWVGITWDNVGK